MGVVQGDGRIVHLKGQVSLDRHGRIVGNGDMKRQVRQTLDNIEAVLAHVGGTMADIISLTHHVTDIRQFMDAGVVRREYFAEPFPVTTTVEISSQILAVARPYHSHSFVYPLSSASALGV